MQSQRPDALYCGIDLGASSAKLVLLDSAGRLQASALRPSGADYAATAQICLQDALAQLSGSPGVVRTIATGQARRNVPFADDFVTELHCHAAGCYRHLGRSCTIVDIGGQDNKVIHLAADGKRTSFKMNRKCAAGTGAFLEEIAVRLDLQVSQLDALARAATEPVHLSSFCTVFAKTEILSHLRAGARVESIVRGAFDSVLARVLEMDPLQGEVVLTGGVAEHNPVLAELLSARLGRQVVVPPMAQHTGALGAGLLALAR
jgi:predicted CoA-substrate-specific enzyme activase